MPRCYAEAAEHGIRPEKNFRPMKAARKDADPTLKPRPFRPVLAGGMAASDSPAEGTASLSGMAPWPGVVAGASPRKARRLLGGDASWCVRRRRGQLARRLQVCLIIT